MSSQTLYLYFCGILQSPPGITCQAILAETSSGAQLITANVTEIQKSRRLCGTKVSAWNLPSHQQLLTKKKIEFSGQDLFLGCEHFLGLSTDLPAMSKMLVGKSELVSPVLTVRGAAQPGRHRCLLQGEQNSSPDSSVPMSLLL